MFEVILLLLAGTSCVALLAWLLAWSFSEPERGEKKRDRPGGGGDATTADTSTPWMFWMPTLFDGGSHSSHDAGGHDAGGHHHDGGGAGGDWGGGDAGGGDCGGGGCGGGDAGGGDCGGGCGGGSGD